MARIFPLLGEKELSEVKSSAEVKLYKALRDSLPDDYLIIFQPRWILKRESEGARDGETDFIVSHPKYGYFTLEVKGGGIRFDGSTWSSIDRSGVAHEIKDPVKQVLNAKYAVKSKIGEMSKNSTFLNSATMGHAVFFPDILKNQLMFRLDLRQELVGDQNDLERIESWVKAVFECWRDTADAKFGEEGCKLLQSVFVHPINAEVTLGGRIAVLGKKRLELTENQFQLLDFIASRRRAAISGGAGTGKTLLALEKTKRLANEGFRTLLTCFNRELAKYLADQLKDYSNVEVMNFHTLCKRIVKIADAMPGVTCMDDATRAYPKADYWSVQLPVALSYALDYYSERFDAIVCDEGQDFGEDFWVPLEFLLSDYETSPFYIFYDTHQNLYSNKLNFPMTDAPYSLTLNCRNTKQIHEFAYRDYQGPAVQEPNLDGEEVHHLLANGLNAQALAIQRKIVELLMTGGVAAEKIVVLVGDSQWKAEKYAALSELPLAAGAKWAIEQGIQGGKVLLDTVKRFKGLEAEVVFIWGMPARDSGDFDEVLYVGSTRAISDLTIVTSKEEYAALAV